MNCTICNKFQGKRKIGSSADTLQRSLRRVVVPKFLWEDILISMESCYCCQILVSGCRGCYESHGLSDLDIQYASLRFEYPLYIEEVDSASREKIVTLHLVDGGRFGVELFFSGEDDCPIPKSWDCMPTFYRTSQRTDSAMALTTIKGWIANCIIYHSIDCLCHTLEYPSLPTRVIDVGLDNGVVRLIEADGEKAKYICLSHCWGREQIITTTRSTLVERKKSIAWEDLSKTFQDAINLTRTLGFRYIWIDSLCIIQDDTRDWEVESSKMASVYSNGHLTIAATHSSDGRGGLFSSARDFRVAEKTPEEEDYCLYFRERIDHQIDCEFDAPGFTSSDKYYPLLTRAWVYQERMLSTRVLHFGRYEMFFECKSDIQCECSLIRFDGPNSETPRPLIKIEYADALSQYDAIHEEEVDADIRYQGAVIWRTMMCCYTALSLTKSQDRLPAIGGLAKQMSMSRKSKYLAGLWSDSLQEDLLWFVHTTSKWKKARPYPRNAPTWSWASVETFISYWDMLVFSLGEENMIQERLLDQHFSIIERCEVRESAIDEFGSIDHGSLTISGLVAEGILECDLEPHKGDNVVVHYVSFQETRLRLQSDYLLDHNGPDHTSPGTPIFCLRMSLMKELSHESLVILALKRPPSLLDTFERIGTLEIKGSAGSVDPNGGIFRTAKSQTVVII